MTGSDVCWCDFPECERRRELARAERALGRVEALISAWVVDTHCRDDCPGFDRYANELREALYIDEGEAERRAEARALTLALRRYAK